MVNDDIFNIHGIHELAEPLRILTSKFHIHGVNHGRFAGFQQVGVIGCSLRQNQTMKRDFTVVNFTDPIRILCNLIFCVHKLSLLNDNVYQQPHSIMGAKRKGGLQSHFENFKAHFEKFQSLLYIYTLNIHRCSQRIMRWITFER
ncbi:hypothetical protein D3C87_1389570 [compost metagenome]